MKQHSQRGGTATGFIIGLVIGLAVALAVAIYVTKVPTPFTNKNQPRSADQDAAEAQKNKDWNPNGALQSKPTTTAVEAQESGKEVGNEAAKTEVKEATKDPIKAPKETIKEVAKEVTKEAAKPDPKPAVTADPLGELVKSKAVPAAPAASAVDPFTYFVQAGAFRSQTEADAQRAKLTMMGLDAKIREREQAGRQVYRVRLGPYDDKDLAERTKSKLDAGGIETALVRVQR